MDIKRVFLIVLDSLGIGWLPDAAEYGDEGSNTLKACFDGGSHRIPVMRGMGLYNIDGVYFAPDFDGPSGSYARLAEKSKGKDTTTGHWEIAGLCSEKPFPVYPTGFPNEIISRFEELTGRGILCNLPYSGTEVLEAYGEEHMRTGRLIVYTSADSVFQIAAHVDVVPLEELYRCCTIARQLLTGEHAVGRVIARPFTGDPGSFTRTADRRDFSLTPPADTLCDVLMKHNLETIGVGKINDIFAGKGISRVIHTNGNTDGMEKTMVLAGEDFRGLAFVNLVDFDMLYGHRNDVGGYTKALNTFDLQLKEFLTVMRREDVLMITADHGCDPSAPGTDHSREYVPLLVYGDRIRGGVNLGTRESYSDISASVLDMFSIDSSLDGHSFAETILPEPKI